MNTIINNNKKGHKKKEKERINQMFSKEMVKKRNGWYQ